MRRLFDVIISVFAAIGFVFAFMVLTSFQIKKGDTIIYTSPFYNQESQ